MSEARICDRCGVIFSIRVDGWTSFTGTRFVVDPVTKKRIQVQETMDACHMCSDTPISATTMPAILPPSDSPTKRSKE